MQTQMSMHPSPKINVCDHSSNFLGGSHSTFNLNARVKKN